MTMETKPDKRPIPTETAIFFIEKDGPSETFTRLARIRKLNKAEAALIRKEVLHLPESESAIYAAAFEAKGYGNERIRGGNRAVAKLLDANALFEDARIHRTIVHEMIAVIASDGLMTNESFLLNKGTKKRVNEQSEDAITLLEKHSDTLSDCIDIRLKPETKLIHKQIAGSIHFFRKASEASDHLVEFMFLICAVDGISGVENIQRGRTQLTLNRLTHPYKQHNRSKIRGALQRAFNKRGELFHANTLMDDVTLENENFHYIGEISILRKVFLDALHAMLIQSKKYGTLNSAWEDFVARCHDYNDTNDDSALILMGSGKRIHANFSPEARELLCSIKTTSLNSIIRPSRGESL